MIAGWARLDLGRRLHARLWRRGRVLAVKLGYNPNSSSLGADVTFLLLGAAAVSVLGPVAAAAVRLALRRRPGGSPAPPARGDAGPSQEREGGQERAC
jgi:hypothetical protein